MKQQTQRIYQNVTLLALDLFARSPRRMLGFDTIMGPYGLRKTTGEQQGSPTQSTGPGIAFQHHPADH